MTPDVTNSRLLFRWKKRRSELSILAKGEVIFVVCKIKREMGEKRTKCPESWGNWREREPGGSEMASLMAKARTFFNYFLLHW
jgi:hypothetical protein